MANDGGYAAVANQEWERSPAYRGAVARHGLSFTHAQLVNAAHRHKAWRALKYRLGVVGRERARDVGGFDERVIRIFSERLEVLDPTILKLINRIGPYLPPLDPCVMTFLPDTFKLGQMLSLEQVQACLGPDVPPDLLAQLMGILGDLVGEFLKELEAAGKFELNSGLPAPQPAAGELGADVVLSEIGATAILTVQVPAAAVRSITTVTLPGPQVVDRIGLFADAAFDGDVQLQAVSPAVSVTGAVAPESVGGDPLISGVSNFGVSGSRMEWLASGTRAEFWPRILISKYGFRVVLTVTNDSVATRTLSAAVDGRYVLSKR